MGPKCMNCGAAAFGITQQSIPGRNFQVHLIHCTQCGTVVGATETPFLEALVRKLARELKVQL